MSVFRKSSILLGFTFAAGAIALAVGCSQSGDDTASSASNDTQATPSQDLVISQVYGGGGNTGAVFQNDYVELFNRGDAAVGLAGKSIQYTAATAAFSSAASVLNLPDVQLQPGHYYLVQLAGTPTPDGGTGPIGAPLPTPDYIATAPLELIAMSKAAGKVAIVPSAALLNGCGTAALQCAAGSFLDLVGYGAASQYEGVPVAILASNTAAIRKAGGCTEFSNNGSDFTVDVPAPRNTTTTPSALCSSVDAGPPPPPVPEGGAPDAAAPSDGGSTTHTDGGKSSKDGGSYHKDGGSHGQGTTAGDDDDDLEAPTGPTTGSSKDPTNPQNAGSGTNSASPPVLPATAPDCAMTPGPISPSGGLAAVFGLALVGAAFRRRRSS